MDSYGKIEIFIKLVFLCQKILTKIKNDKKVNPIFKVKIQKIQRLRKKFSKIFFTF